MNVAKVFGKTEVDSPIAAGAGKKIIRGFFYPRGFLFMITIIRYYIQADNISQF